MMTFRVALRNVFRHTARSLITVSAIAFGCTAVIFVGGFFEDLFYKMRESYIKGHTGHLQVYARGFFEHGSGNPFDYLIENPGEIAGLIQELEGVETVTQRIGFAGLLSTGENTVSCIAQGIEPDQEPMVRLADLDTPRQDLPSLSGSVIELGDLLDAQEPYTAILGRGLAASLGAHVGDGLILVSHTVGGTINALDVTVKGTFYTSSKVFDDHTLRLPLGTAQQLLQTDAVQSLVILLHRTDDTARIKEEMAWRFDRRGLPLEIKTWEELSDFYQKTRALFARMFLVLKIVIAIIVILSIFNTMNMAVLERTSEIGTIMALGEKRAGVVRLFLYEGAILGAVGGASGLAAGVALTAAVQRIGIPMPPPPGATMPWFSEPLIVPDVLLYAFGLALMTSLLSSVYPAYKASRLEVAEALRHAG